MPMFLQSIIKYMRSQNIRLCIYDNTTSSILYCIYIYTYNSRKICEILAYSHMSYAHQTYSDLTDQCMQCMLLWVSFRKC